MPSVLKSILNGGSLPNRGLCAESQFTLLMVCPPVNLTKLTGVRRAVRRRESG
jgi:hypothetical protein